MTKNDDAYDFGFCKELLDALDACGEALAVWEANPNFISRQAVERCFRRIDCINLSGPARRVIALKATLAAKR